MMDRVGDRRRDADDADHAHTLDAEWIAIVRLVDKDHPDVVHIGVHRHMILGDVGVHDAAEAVIDQRLLVQGHTDPPGHAAEDLATGGLRVQDASGGDRADHARDAYDTQLLVHFHLGKHRRMYVVRPRVILGGAGGQLPLDAVHAAVPHGI